MTDTHDGQNNSRNILITALLCAGAVAYVFFVFMPGQKKIGLQREQLKDKQKYIISTNQMPLKIDQIQREMEAAQQFTKQWQATAPTEAKLSSLYGAITAQAKQAGVAVVEFDPQQTEKLQTVWRIKVKVGFDGDFRQCFDFVRRVEQNPATIWMSEVSMKPQGKNEGKIHGEVTLTIFADNRDNSG